MMPIKGSEIHQFTTRIPSLILILPGESTVDGKEDSVSKLFPRAQQKK